MSSSSSQVDDIFSSQSATTSATSLSLKSVLQRSSSKVRPKWSKDVRWLVPPDPTTLLQSVELVDVEYAHRRGRKRAKKQSDRMSAVWEEEEDFEDVPPIRAHTISRVAGARRVRPTALPTRSSSLSIPSSPRPTTLSSSMSVSSSTDMLSTPPSTSTVTLPTPLPVSSGVNVSSTGYSSLTLPRAAYTPAKHPGRLSTSVDITRSGLAQTTMSTIAITQRLRTPTDTPLRLRASLPCPLSFTAHTPPPNKLPSSHVLVQVWAVALDTLDALLVDERAAKSDGLGYVPGRSFVGKAIECGWDVNNVNKGDWLFGLTEIRKSGALSEFIVVDRRRIHLSPHPSAHLSLGQIALLPLAGIPARRAARTLAHLPRGSRALVLHAHSGPGLLATQELAALGFSLTAQVQAAWGSPEERRVRLAGARDVRCGEAVDIVNDVRGEEFDAVIDPIGGKDVWHACRRILRSSGQFTTLIGDTYTAVPSANSHFKSNMRSLRRAFVKKDHKSIGYQWVSPAADVDSGGEDVRDSLAAVARMAVDGVLVPHVDEGTSLPFERAPEAFQIQPATDRSMLSRGGTVVVRIIE